MVPRRGSLGVICAFRSFSIASRISHRMPEKPCKSVFVRTSMAARVVATGNVLPEFTTPAFKNLEKPQQQTRIDGVILELKNDSRLFQISSSA